MRLDVFSDQWKMNSIIINSFACDIFVLIGNTWTWVSATFFNSKGFARACPAIGFNDQFGAGVISCSRSTRLRAYAFYPIAPFAIDFLIFVRIF